MRIPTRTAPRPPGQSATRRDPIWSSSNDIFEGTLMAQPVQRKKPPPRPPPPKFNQNHMQYQKDQKPRKPARPTELLTNFFGRKKQESPFPSRSANQSQSSTTQSTTSVMTMSLIDLSPPGSPTFTTRSSSDGVSVDSFGSDGNSNPSAFTSSGNTSQTESAFEDDFDFFGMSKKTAQNDPWQSRTTPQDPFGPLEDACSKPSQAAGSLFSLNSNSRVTSQVPSNLITSKPLITSMPTIIRARPPKPPAPKLPLKKFVSTAKGTCNSYKVFNTGMTENAGLAVDLFNAWPDDCEQSDSSPSPPMPTIPPPALPATYLAELDSDLAVSIKYYMCTYLTELNALY
ncbi:hypothetical protein DMN91_002786 [Ooceraea biroi]|uniref:Uncharacterized protein n=1 Tax=Ooceraea biroi TaxID=2015173 RepID=A0A3L8DW85_OOCBI|nr:hypothetical protein DMN91_002786 [Ooceraea biroi]